MELDEMKNLWQAEDKNLESKIILNEAHLMKMNMDNATGEVDKIFSLSLLGRNMALVYCLISTGMAIFIIESLEYSIPALLGGSTMLWSYISHLSLKKPNYKESIIQIQKTICNFRIHMAANAKYDIMIVALWFLTIAPIFLKIVYKVSLYNDYKALAIFCVIAGITLVLLIATSRRAYAEYETSLKKFEVYLEDLNEFETKNIH